MTEREIRERDILVAPNEYAYVQDLTKGDIVLYVGPTKISLSNTERVVVLRAGRFIPVRGEDVGFGVHPFMAATSSQYIVLENPPRNAEARPVKGANSAIELLMGRKIVIPGPAEFPLWPGQRAVVLDGHALRQNEYLVARVYDTVADASLPIGTELIIRGTDVSFYVPENGLEVVPLAGDYVRRAFRLEKNGGLHVRVVKDFVADEAHQLPPGSYAAGQDVFLREREGFFFPTDHVEVVRAVTPTPLADKEGLYMRNIDTGTIRTVEGPVNYLVDPTREEIVVREVTLRTELYASESYDGSRALSVSIPPSNAVMIVAKNRREVVVGPQTRILAYDEELEALELSTGRPKSDEQLLATCFLKIEGNKVSDVLRVKTADHVELEILLSYRVSFAGAPEKWFDVKDYVGLLCDHLASIIRAATRGKSIDAFHASSADVVRSAVLGARREEGKREGRQFAENGMWVYDVEVLDVRILDDDVKRLLSDAQRRAIASDVRRKQEELRLGDEQIAEVVNREVFAAKMATFEAEVSLEAKKRAAAVARTSTSLDVERLKTVTEAELEAEALRIGSDARLAVAEREAELAHKGLVARAAAFREQMAALQPELISTLKVLGNQHLTAELSKHLSPLAILGGESIADIATRLMRRLPLGENGAVHELFDASGDA